jgi:glyoxylase-like metal-dependent hydrolase (beta-lactamase superfamily II)
LAVRTVDLARATGLSVKTTTLPPLSTNCYLVADGSTRKALVVDPSSQAEELAAYLAAQRLTLELIVITHNHYDHAGGARRLQALTGAPLVIHEDQRQQTRLGVSYDGLNVRHVAHRTQLRLGAQVFEVLHTPGHSRGSLCLWHREAGVLWSGDLLFQGAIGRTDFPGGSSATIQASLRQLMSLVPPHTLVLPGHGEFTTMGRELNVVGL